MSLIEVKLGKHEFEKKSNIYQSVWFLGSELNLMTNQEELSAERSAKNNGNVLNI